MKFLKGFCGILAGVGIAVIFYSVALIEKGEITKERLLLAGAGLALMGIGAALERVAQKVEEQLSFEEDGDE